MTQSWKRWSWKLGLGIAVATSVISSCGYYAMAGNTKKPFLLSWTLGKFLFQPVSPNPNTGRTNKLRFKSIRSNANYPSSGKIYIYIQESDVTSDPYPISSGKEVSLDMDICFNNTVTVEVHHQVNQEYPEIVGQKPVLNFSSSTLVFDGISKGAPYTLNYEVVPEGCK